MLAFNDSPEDSLIIKKLFKEKYNQMISYATKITHNIDMALDVVDFCFLIIIERFDQYRNFTEDRLERYLCRCVYYRCIHILKDYKKEIFFDNFDFQTEFDEFSEKIFHNADLQTLRQCITKLSIKDQELIYLRYYKEYSEERIAKIFKLEESNIHVKIWRAKKRLRIIYQSQEKNNN